MATALFPQTRRSLLGLLYGLPDQAFYLREIVQRTGTGMGQVQRELERLAEAGILRSFRQGRQLYYQADRRCPIFNDLCALVVKTMAGADHLRRALAGLADRIVVAFVFGSVARGEDDASSDLDLFVVGDVLLQEVVAATSAAQEALGRQVNPAIYPKDELRSKLADGNHFLTSVMEGEKVFVIGTQNELGKLLPEPLDPPAHDLSA